MPDLGAAARRRRGVATVRALNVQSGRYDILAGRDLPPGLHEERPGDVADGAANLRKQIENVRAHGVTPVVAVNAFPTDHPSERDVIAGVAAEMGARVAVCAPVLDGGAGVTESAEAVAAACDEPDDFHFLYPEAASLTPAVRSRWAAPPASGPGALRSRPVRGRPVRRRPGRRAGMAFRPSTVGGPVVRIEAWRN